MRGIRTEWSSKGLEYNMKGGNSWQEMQNEMLWEDIKDWRHSFHPPNQGSTSSRFRSEHFLDNDMHVIQAVCIYG
jgi:hypothetical protein